MSCVRSWKDCHRERLVQGSKGAQQNPACGTSHSALPALNTEPRSLCPTHSEPDLCSPAANLFHTVTNEDVFHTPPVVPKEHPYPPCSMLASIPVPNARMASPEQQHTCSRSLKQQPRPTALSSLALSLSICRFAPDHSCVFF